jgi:hypothetical protein
MMPQFAVKEDKWVAPALPEHLGEELPVEHRN